MRLLASLHYKSVKLPKWNQSQNTMKSLVDFNVNKKNTAGFASYAVQEATKTLRRLKLSKLMS